MLEKVKEIMFQEIEHPSSACLNGDTPMRHPEVVGARVFRNGTPPAHEVPRASLWCLKSQGVVDMLKTIQIRGRSIPKKNSDMRPPAHVTYVLRSAPAPKVGTRHLHQSPLPKTD